MPAADPKLEYGRLLSVIAHDLKAPARALRQYVQMIQDVAPRGLPEPLQRYLGRLGDVASRLDAQLDVVSELARLARSEPGDAPTSLAEALERALAERGRAAIGRIGADLPDVRLSVEASDVLFSALVDNALAAGATTLALAWHDGRFVLDDDGTGVAELAGAQAFTPFRPVPRPDSGHRGLGLSRAACIVWSAGGDLGLEPLTPTGTRVWLELPR